MFEAEASEHPRSSSFNDVSCYVNMQDVTCEDLKNLCLMLAAELETARNERRNQFIASCLQGILASDESQDFQIDKVSRWAIEQAEETIYQIESPTPSLEVVV